MSNKKIVSYDDYVNKVSWHDLRHDRERQIYNTGYWERVSEEEMRTREIVSQAIQLREMGYDESTILFLLSLGRKLEGDSNGNT